MENENPFCGKRESDNSRFVENENPKTRFSFFCGKRESGRILVLWKKENREFSFCGTREFVEIREFSFCGEFSDSRFVENENLLFWKRNPRIRFVENQNPRIPVLWKTTIIENSEICGKREFLVLWKTRIR